MSWEHRYFLCLLFSPAITDALLASLTTILLKWLLIRSPSTSILSKPVSKFKSSPYEIALLHLIMFITLSTSEPYSFLISQLRPAAHPRTSLTLPSLCLWTSLPPPSAWILLGSVFSPWLFSLTSLEISLCPKLSTPTPMSAVQISVLSISFLYPATCWTLPFQCSFIFSISKQVSSDLMFCWIWNGDCDERKNPLLLGAILFWSGFYLFVLLFPSQASIPTFIF